MNKKELIKKVSQSSNIIQKDVEKIINDTLQEIRQSLYKGEKVTLTGFGTFIVEEKKERDFINPLTHESTLLPAMPTVKFKSSKNLKHQIRSSVHKKTKD